MRRIFRICDNELVLDFCLDEMDKRWSFGCRRMRMACQLGF